MLVWTTNSSIQSSFVSQFLLQNVFRWPEHTLLCRENSVLERSVELCRSQTTRRDGNGRKWNRTGRERILNSKLSVIIPISGQHMTALLTQSLALFVAGNCQYLLFESLNRTKRLYFGNEIIQVLSISRNMSLNHLHRKTCPSLLSTF